MIVRLLGLVLLSYAAYIGLSFSNAPTLSSALWGACFFACGLGLIFHVRWAAYLWYVLAIVTSASWIWAVIGVARTGWPYADVLRSVISLIPGLGILAVCGLGSVAVAKQFRRSTRM